MNAGKVIIMALLILVWSCSKNETTIPDEVTPIQEVPDANEFANIDFSHWKITLPVDQNNDGKPDEYQPNALVNLGYQNIAALTPFLYDDIADKSIVFYTYPGGATTANSSYPRTELREQMTPGNNYHNWKLNTGGELYGKLKVADISEDSESSRTHHRVIIMQIHGVVSQEDMATYNLDSNHAPPLLKIIWDEGHIKAYQKKLVNENTSGVALYDDSSNTWTDTSYDFGEVNQAVVIITIKAETGKLTISANSRTHIFQDISLEKWPFENYFKAGAYLTATHANAFAKVKYYELTVSH